jgi:hypothetical protein
MGAGCEGDVNERRERMTYVEGHFYRDAEGDVWQAVNSGQLKLAALGDGSPCVLHGDVWGAWRVAAQYGPLTEVRQIWEAV